MTFALKRFLISTLLGAAVLGSGMSLAQMQQHPGMGNRPMPMPHGQPSSNPVIAAYHVAMQKMHGDMPAELTGDADRDFATMMIPHHQGAIDVAGVVVQHGKDGEIKKRATTMISDQEKEIAFFRSLLARAPR